jgi:hypothetical protein
MKRSRYSLYAIVYSVAVAMVGYLSHTFLHLSSTELLSVVASATAAPLFGIVLFDFKAFSRAAALMSKLITDRLGHRTCSVGSLCRPHGL